ncbi:hypothetical protein M0805_002998 [Coniferiporia weirii]|nr:hypothetical protein M0805_002998 [Coniferiporia weirii]
MSSPRRPEAEVYALAKKQLQLPVDINDSAVPGAFLAELKRHISMFPDDTRFCITTQPGRGFGVAECLEEGCGQLRIQLTKNSKVADGGKNDGVGSLMSYRTHINEHPTHKMYRRARIQASASCGDMSRSNSNSSTSTGSGQPMLKDVFHRLAASTSASPGRFNVTSTPGASKSIPAKRPLEEDVDIDGFVYESFSDEDSDIVSVRTPQQTLDIPQLTMTSARAEGSPKVVRARMELPPLPHDHDKTPRTLTITSELDRTFPEAVMSPGPAIKQVPMTPAASSSRVQLPVPLVPSQKEMTDGPVDQVMEHLSVASGVLDKHPLAGIAHHDYSDDDGGEYSFGRGRDRFRGPVAQTADLQHFFHEAGNAELFDGNASVAKSLKRLDLPNLNTPFPGMDITLMPHQAIGVAWMLDKEKSANKGGILSDEMGLGKTVQMIATMMANRSTDPAVKTTLIVAPLALLGQWKLEIETKTTNNLSVHIYHGAGKAKHKKELQKFDAVLTTFSTLALEWPDYEGEERKRQKEKNKRSRSSPFVADDSEEEERKKQKKPGLLLAVNWYRVVLDEAQNIRNKRTRVSRAVTDLNSTYRWCLSGTPITNSLGDAYPLIRFLQIRPWYDWEEFNNHITRFEKRYPKRATEKLQAIFSTCLLRRKKDTLLDGKRLVELPPKDVQLHKLEFTPDEREIYNMVETRSQQVFNKYLRAGTVLKNYVHVLVLLLRLRQVCSHTSLITEQDGVIIDEDLENSGVDKRDELILAQTRLGRDFVNKIRSKLKNIALERMAAELQSVDASVENEECPICFDVLTDAVVTPCMHFFCRDCIDQVLKVQQAVDAEHPNPNERPCPACRASICRDKLFSREAFEPDDDELAVAKSGPKAEEQENFLRAKSGTDDEEMPDITMLLSSHSSQNKPKSRPNRKSNSKQGTKRALKKRRVLDSDEDEGAGADNDSDDDLSDFIVQSDEDEEGKDARRTLRKRLGKRRASSPVDYDDSGNDSVIIGICKQPASEVGDIKVLSRMLPSTKMMHMMESLLKWAEEYPNEKTMIISQWTQCLELVSNYLTSKSIGHVRFQGDMSREKRDKAVRTFMKKSGARVLLMSLKCGGVGLNLTRANRVISLDLGWSEAVESQAFDRVHRLGQTRPVVVERLVINNTVEDRVLAMQEKKKNLADGSLGEGNGRKIGRLTVRELASLFNLDPGGRVLGS